MSEFKTRAEISAATELIQHLEQLLSGPITGTDGGAIPTTGINRALERLAENDNALLEELNRVRVPLEIIGDFDWASGTLTWSSSIVLSIFSQIHGTLANTVTAGSIGPMVAGDVAWIVIDRTSTAAWTSGDIVTGTGPAFLAALGAASDRLDFYVIGAVVGTSFVMPGGKWLRDGYGLTNFGATETQYGQQTELTQVRETVRENMNLRITGGGDIYWDSNTPILSWSEPIVIEFPGLTGDNFIAAGSVALTPDHVAYVTLDRTAAEAGSAGPLPVTVVLNGSVPYDTVSGGDDKFVIAIHTSADNRVYLADGSALSDGETIKLGGARVGVQWYFQEPGQGTNTSDQVQDLSASVSAASYRVGTGELMVYRNGIKAIPSKAFWEGGLYAPIGPVVGALNTSKGNIEPGHDYIEEDATGTGVGTRIIWLRDDVGGGEPENHPANTHDPLLTYPDTDELIEAFVGVQGQAPTITVPDGIYGFDVVWTDYNAGTTKVRTSVGTLISTGDRYPQLDDNHLEIDETATLLEGGGVSINTWHYVYMCPGAQVGDPPQLRLSAQPPDPTINPGRHPLDPTCFFLTSVYVTGGGNFESFTKQGSRVTMHADEPEMAAAFSIALGSFVSVDLGPYLPETSVGGFRILLHASTDPLVNAGDRVGIQHRQTDYPAPAGTLYAIKPGNDDDVQYEIEVVSKDGTFEILFDTGDFLGSVTTCYLLGYNEGRLTAGSGLGG